MLVLFPIISTGILYSHNANLPITQPLSTIGKPHGTQGAGGQEPVDQEQLNRKPITLPNKLHNQEPNNDQVNYQKYVVGSGGRALRISDINQDGLNDVILTTEARRIQIWYQNPECHGLEKSLEIPTLLDTADIAIADINDDDLLDIIALTGERKLGEEGDYLSAKVELFLQQADGFGTAATTTYSVGTFPLRVIVEDITRDQRPDILVTSWDRVHMLTQQPDNTFTSTTISYPITDTQGSDAYMYDIVTGHFNDDEHIDVAIQDYTFGFSLPRSSIWLYQYDAQTGLLMVDESIEGRVEGMVAGDVSGDGKDDIISISDTIIYHEQSSDGSFATPEVIPLQNNANSGSNPLLYDMNSDGLSDLIFMNQAYKSYTVHYQAEAGGFEDRTNYAIFSETDLVNLVQGDLHSRFADIGDVTGDGIPDIVFVNTTEVMYIASQGPVPEPCESPSVPEEPSPTIAPVFSYSYLGGAPWAVWLHTADINNDGLLDLITKHEAISEDGQVIETLRPILQKNDASFELGLPLYPTSDSIHSMSVGDFNNDEYIDVAMYVDNRVEILYQETDGSFGSSTQISSDPNYGLPQLVVADFNNDGADDLGIIKEDSGFYVHYQTTNGELQPATEVLSMSDAGRIPYVLPLDWNRDGNLDLVIVNEQNLEGDNVKVFLQDDDGSYSLFTSTSYAEGIYAVATGDINGDDRVDIALLTTDQIPYAKVGLVIQNEDGTLPLPEVLNESDWDLPSNIIIVDINGDQRNDIVLTHDSNVFNLESISLATYLSVSLQTPTGQFERPILFPDLPLQYGSIAEIDSDKDGIPESLAVVSYSDSGIVTLIKPLANHLYLPFSIK